MTEPATTPPAVTQIIKEFQNPLRRLGRHILHDERSWKFDIMSLFARKPRLTTTMHVRHALPFDQGNLGSCTGNAMAGVLMTEPYWRSGLSLDETSAVSLYQAATQLDDIDGTYPPDDTGSSGLAVMKAAQKLGYIKAYYHAFGLQATLQALQHYPVIVGTNWYSNMDTPNMNQGALVSATGALRGGHEYEIVGLDVAKRVVRCCNSWGSSWGDGGYFTMSWDDLGKLLDQQGDVTIAVA